VPGSIVPKEGTTMTTETRSEIDRVALPAPRRDGGMALASAVSRRRSLREFGAGPLTLEALAQLLWSAQGVTAPDGGRTAPSAGALYPLEILVAAGDVERLETGLYRYRPHDHVIERITANDPRRALARAAVRQDWIARAPAVLAITAVPSRTAAKYGGRARRYVDLEVGHAVENVCLQAVALGLGTTVVGAFDDDDIARLLRLPSGERPRVLLPVGPVG